MKFFIQFIFVQLAALQVLDGYLTYLGVSRYGSEIEGNPIVKYFIDTLGPIYGLLLIKGIAFVICLYVICSKLFQDKKIYESLTVAVVLSLVHLFYIIVIVGWLVILIPDQAKLIEIFTT